MAASKSKNTGHSGRNTKKKTAMEQEVGRFQTEIILFVILAACVILMASNFGAGGFVGDAISNFCFGLMGLMAYLFPIVFFLESAFILINKTNRLAYKKLAAAFVMFLFLCGAAQLLTDGYMQSTTLLDYYALSADYKTGGGLIGGAICISVTSAFGTIGGYVIIILAFVVCMIIITQRSLLDFVTRLVIKVCDFVKDRHMRYMQGQPERERYREERARERQLIREQRREERVRRLEEEIGDDEFSDDDFLMDPSEAKKMKKGGFLEGTKLTGYSEQKPKKKGKLLKKAADTDKAAAETAEAAEDTVNTGIKSSDDADNKPYIDAPMNFEIHRADTSPDTYEADNESQQQEDLPFEDAVTDRKKSVVSEPEEDLPPFQDEKAVRPPSKNPKSSEKEIQSGIVNIQHEITRQEATVKKEYKFPALNLLKKGSSKAQGDSDAYLRKTAKKLQEVLHNFGVNVTVTNVSCGPTVTRYELQPEMGVKVSKIVGLADDIKLNLATPDIRIEAPIPGKAAVGIEVPNKENSTVMLRDLLQSEEFQKAKSKLSFAVGKDIAGKTVVADIAKMPHLLIAGATGSGKSVCINTLIISILYKANPDEVKLIMIDPKVVELSVYNGIPHLFIPVVTDPKKAASALNWAVREMLQRYNDFAAHGVRDIKGFNKLMEEKGDEKGKMPQIVIIIDELADLMMAAPGEVEDAICRLAQMARAAGMHLIIATQRPSVDVITGVIKANIPSRLAFAVSSGIDSRTILDMVGAEKLLGKGDMLFYPSGQSKPSRLQGAFVTDQEVEAIVDFLKKSSKPNYTQETIDQITAAGKVGGAAEDSDEFFSQAVDLILEKEKASVSMLQRQFRIGYNRAARLMDDLEKQGIVGPEEGSKPRKVLITKSEWEEMTGAVPDEI